MKRVMTILKRRHSRKIIIYLLICCLVLNTSLPAVLATPSGPSPGGGSFSIQSGTGEYNNTTLVNVFSPRTIINWESLDTLGGAVDVRETLAFSQNSYGDNLVNSAVLNRISGPATQFNGDLSAPGMRIFMVNPAGIVFGEGATVNVSQLVASGLNMSNEAFYDILDDASNPMIFSGGNGEVQNSGTISADKVILVGNKVLNLGSIYATDGLVVMAAGDNVYLTQDGSKVLVELLEDPADTTVDVQNSGLSSAKNGKIVLAAGDTFSRAVSNVGTLSATGGEVKMEAANVENKGVINVSSTTDGGSVDLTGIEAVTIGPDDEGATGIIEANGGINGKGGTINITAGTETVEGKITIENNSLITATGGSEIGLVEVGELDGEPVFEEVVPAGGTVTITCDNFEIAGDIDASPGDNIFEQGKLVINSSSAIIADGPNPGDMEPPVEVVENTLYEEDIEYLSQAGTDLILNTVEGIVVKDITDGPDGLEPGVISGQFGSIELHATGENSAITFVDNTDTIRTSLGDIIIEAGAGGINVGNLTTGKDIYDEKPKPGRIVLSTSNGGDITTGDLLIRDGQGLAKIDVDSSGSLTVNGDVIVGSESDILNVPNGQNAHAAVYLNAANSIELNGNAGAYAEGIDDDVTEDDKTMAEIRIFAGKDFGEFGDAVIKGDIVADAQSSSQGTAEAVVEVDAWGNVDFAEGAEAYAVVDNEEAVAGPGTESEENTSLDGDHAQIIIHAQEYITPPPVIVPDEFSTNKSDSIALDVLANDTQMGELFEGGVIHSYTQPAEGTGTVTPTRVGDKIVGITYNPPEDFSALTFNENGEATVTFTYFAKDAAGSISEDPGTVTITLVNGLPNAVQDLVTTVREQSVNINVLTNDTDSDLGDLLTAIEGSVTPKNGTIVLNEDGTFTYTPNKGFLGKDSFTYSVTDGLNESSEVEVKITVDQVPMIPAPGLDKMNRVDVEVSGCPALAKWVATELGIDEGTVEIRMANSLASNEGIPPYDTYSKLRKAAMILQDVDGSHMEALVQVINDFASSNAPLSEEQILSIADAITSSTDKDSYYAVAKEYLDAVLTYTSILSSEMGVSAAESVKFITYKYINPTIQTENVGVTVFLEACSSVLGG